MFENSVLNPVSQLMNASIHGIFPLWDMSRIPPLEQDLTSEPSEPEYESVDEEETYVDMLIEKERLNETYFSVPSVRAAAMYVFSAMFESHKPVLIKDDDGRVRRSEGCGLGVDQGRDGDGIESRGTQLSLTPTAGTPGSSIVTGYAGYAEWVRACAQTLYDRAKGGR